MLYRRTRPRANRTVAAFFSAAHAANQTSPEEEREEQVHGSTDTNSAGLDSKEQTSGDVFPEPAEKKEPTARETLHTSGSLPDESKQVGPSTSPLTDILPPSIGIKSEDASEKTAPSPSTPLLTPPTPTSASAKASPSPGRASPCEDSAPSFLAQKSRRKRATVADRYAARDAPVPSSTATSSDDKCDQSQSSTSGSSKDIGCVGGANQPSPVVNNLGAIEAGASIATASMQGFDGEDFLAGQLLLGTIGSTDSSSSSSSDDVIMGSRSNSEDGNQSAIARDVDFEIWVETDIQPSWCLDVGDGDAGHWRGACQTASLRRKWEEFEALGQQVIPGITDISMREALELLGLPEDLDLGQVQEQAASAFRQQSRSCHPDKNGGADSDKFQALVAAYQVIQRSASLGPNA